MAVLREQLLVVRRGLVFVGFTLSFMLHSRARGGMLEESKAQIGLLGRLMGTKHTGPRDTGWPGLRSLALLSLAVKNVKPQFRHGLLPSALLRSAHWTMPHVQDPCSQGAQPPIPVTRTPGSKGTPDCKGNGVRSRSSNDTAALRSPYSSYIWRREPGPAL